MHPQLSLHHIRRIYGNFLYSGIRFNSLLITSSFIYTYHYRKNVHEREPANKRTAPASPRAAGWYSIWAMQLPRRIYGLLLRQLYIYQIFNWPTDLNVILRLHDELINCGTHLWGLQRYYILEMDSGLGAFAFFQLQYACWTRGIASALGMTGVVPPFKSPAPSYKKALPWWGEAVREPQYPEDLVNRTE